MSKDIKRVLVVTQFFPPEGIGGGYRWEQFIDRLPAEYRCRVVCPPPTLPYGEFDRTYRPISRQKVGDVPVTRLWTYQPTSDTTAEESNVHRVLNYGIFALFATLYIVANAWRYDCVVTMSSPHTTFIPGYVGNLLGLSWVVDIYDRWLDNALDFGYAESGSLVVRFFSRLERAAMTLSDAVITITPTLAEAFQEKYSVDDSDRFTAIPFGVDPDIFPPEPQKTGNRQVVYVGNLGEVHAFDAFLRGFARLPDDTELVFVGDGKRRGELEQLADELDIADRVRFVGTILRDEIPKILADSAASIVPLETDQHLDYACPTKLVETLAVGTPFVGSRLKEIERVADRSGAGYVVTNDPGEVHDRFATLLADPQLRTEMGEHGVAYVNEHHRWDGLTDDVERVLRQC